MQSRVGPHRKSIEGAQSTSFPPAIAPLENDVVITKRHIFAFAGTDIKVALRSLGVDSLYMCGIALSGVLLPIDRWRI
jgi:nicotinamidase-related amidase